jgi:hypothetical protein
VLRRLHENVRRFRSELWRQICSCCITTTHRSIFPSSPGNFFYRKQHNCRPYPTKFSLLPRLIRLNDRHFDIIEVFEVGGAGYSSQNTTSSMHLKREGALETVDMRARELLRGWWWPVGAKVAFDHMKEPVLEIMDDSHMATGPSTFHTISHCYLHIYYLSVRGWKTKCADFITVSVRGSLHHTVNRDSGLYF